MLELKGNPTITFTSDGRRIERWADGVIHTLISNAVSHDNVFPRPKKPSPCTECGCLPKST